MKQLENLPQTLITGLGYGESPRWHDGRLWFCNWTMREIAAIDTDGKIDTSIQLPFNSFPFSIDWLPDGRLIIVSGSDQPLLRREPNGSFVPHADLSALHVKTFNEIVIDSRGNIYINGDDIIALVRPDGSVSKVAENISFPNGMIVTNDNSTLIIAESYGKRLTAFDMHHSGSLSGRRTWADLKDGAPDGICLDAEGAIWYGDVPNKRCVRVCEGGEILQVVHLAKGCFACALGGTNKKTLFMMLAEWRGFEKMFDGKCTGEIQVVHVSVKAAK